MCVSHLWHPAPFTVPDMAATRIGDTSQLLLHVRGTQLVSGTAYAGTLKPHLALHCPLQAGVVVGSTLVVEVVQVASSTNRPSPPHLAPLTLCPWALAVMVL
jgi:hypothetical protein